MKNCSSNIAQTQKLKRGNSIVNTHVVAAMLTAAACVSVGLVSVITRNDKTFNRLNEELACVPVNGYQELLKNRIINRENLVKEFSDFNKHQADNFPEHETIFVNYYTTNISKAKAAEATYRRLLNAAQRKKANTFPNLNCNQFT